MSGAATIAAVAAVASVGVAAYSTIEQKKANGRARDQQEEAINNQRAAQAEQQAQAERAMQQQQQQATEAMAAQQAQATSQMQAAEKTLEATTAQFEKQNVMQQNQLKTAEESSNKYGAKRPNTSAMSAATEQAAKAGASGTMLTGPQGIDPNTLSLSKNTLLGS